jgi:hypothetical protein
MNERIDKLLVKAGAYFGGEGVVYDTFDPKKFAELIVRECMNAVCDPGTTYLESMTESSAMYTARERIRKHFGVEE